MLVGECRGHRRGGGVPRASVWPCQVPWGNRLQAGGALGAAKVHVEHLGVRKDPCGASRAEQGPCRVSQGEQLWEVPWAEPRAVRSTAEAAG